MSEQGALRFDNDKVRHDLLPADAINELAKVLTVGAKKYAPNNWRKGMAWSRVIGSLKRHLNAIERGEDYDPETGLLHAAHVMCNAAFLTEYYKIYPHGDDRELPYLKYKRIAIDIDDVLADFIGAYCKKFNIPIAKSWNFDAKWQERYNEILKDDSFYLSLTPLITASQLGFEPVAYITARKPTMLEATRKWLFDIAGFPIAPVICAEDKLAACQDLEVNVFIDDKINTFLHLNKNGILCYLYDAPHNQGIDVGYKRINKDTIKNIL